MTEPLSDDRIATLLEQAERFEHTFKPEVLDKLIDAEKAALAFEVKRYRSMLRRLGAFADSLQKSSCLSPLAAELLAAMSGVAYLYCCPEHGDLRPQSQHHARGVPCSRVDAVRGKRCVKIATLVGQVDVP